MKKCVSHFGLIRTHLHAYDVADKPGHRSIPQLIPHGYVQG